MSGFDNRRHVAPDAIYRGLGVGASGVSRGKVWDGAADSEIDLQKLLSLVVLIEWVNYFS